MQIITRAEWGARPPKSAPTLTTWARRTGFMVHHSAGPISQSVRAIQDFHMDTRDWNDIGYNFLVRPTDGAIYEGRGWLTIGAHCGGHNTENIGVCVLGTDPLTDAAKRSLRWLYDGAVRRKGSRLVMLGHRDRGRTECPGDDLYAWVRAGMPGAAPTPTPPPSSPPALAVDGRMGPLTIRRWQKIMGTPADGIISRDSALVRAVQRHLNAAGARPRLVVDGAGIRQDGRRYATVRALQSYLGTPADGILSVPVSPAVKALQRRLNTGRF